MREIPLTQNKVALVDDVSYELLSKRKWFAVECRRTFYAATRVKFASGKSEMVRMHRFLIGAKRGQLVDHCDGDGLNNQLANIRICSAVENSHNQRIAKNNTSGFKGVYWRKDRSVWKPRIHVSGKTVYLGSYDCKIEAAKAYNVAAIKHYGPFARLNQIP